MKAYNFLKITSKHFLNFFKYLLLTNIIVLYKNLKIGDLDFLFCKNYNLLIRNKIYFSIFYSSRLDNII